MYKSVDGDKSQCHHRDDYEAVVHSTLHVTEHLPIHTKYRKCICVDKKTFVHIGARKMCQSAYLPCS